MDTFKIISENEIIIKPKMIRLNDRAYVSKEVMENPKELHYLFQTTPTGINISGLEQGLYGLYKDSKYKANIMLPKIAKSTGLIEAIAIYFASIEGDDNDTVIKTDFSSYKGIELLTKDIYIDIPKIDISPIAKGMIHSLRYKKEEDIFLQINNSEEYRPDNN